MKQILLTLILILPIIASVKLGNVGDISDNSSIIDPTKAELQTSATSKPTEGEVGLVATLAGVYGKSRDAVKMVYDEIQYWKGIKATFSRVGDWFKTQKSRFKNIGRTAETLFTEPENVFVKLEQAEDMFNSVDALAYGAPAELHQIFRSGEAIYDKIADGKLSGALLPNTGEMVESFDIMVFNSDMSPKMKKKVLDESFYPDDEKKLIENREDFFDKESKSYEGMQEKRVLDLIKTMSASIIENSNMYTAWGYQTTKNLNEQIKILDAKFQNGEMDNIMDLQCLSAMQDIEMINQNNKRILHSLELLKGYNALLGIDIWVHNAEKTQNEALTSELLYIHADMLREKQIVAENIATYGTIRKPSK